MRVICSILLAALFALGCTGDEAGPVAGERYVEMKADQVLFDVEHYLTTEGVRRALLRADTMYLYRDSAEVGVRQVHLDLFNRRGRKTAVVTAERGRLDTRTESMVARGNVVVVTTEGDRRIETEVLHFSPRRNLIWSDTATTFYKPGSIIHGTGFTSDPGLNNVEIQHPTGEFKGVEIEF